MKWKYLTPLAVQEELISKNLKIFTPLEFRRLFQAPVTQAKYFLEAYTRKGLFIRLKQGLYALKNYLPDEEEIANILYRPSYVSFEYALAKFGIIPEMVYAVTCATTKPTRTFTVQEKEFNYFTIKKSAFTGYVPIKSKGRTIFIAEPEKALVDYLYFVSIGKKPLNDRLNLKNLKISKIKKFAALYERPGLNKLIKQLFYDK